MYTFTKTPDPTNEFDLSTVTVEVKETENLELFDVIESFESYLAACGYILNGSLAVVNKDGTIRKRRETESELWAKELFLAIKEQHATNECLNPGSTGRN